MSDAQDQKLTRRGLVLHKSNPFVVDAATNTRHGVRKIVGNSADRMMIVSESSGEVVAKGAGFWQAQEVDRTQFVKLYINGVRALKDLTQAGTKVFAVLFEEVQKQIGRDVVQLSFLSVNQELNSMSQATYTRGIRELVDKNFIAATPLQSTWYINPDFIFNGDRLAFVKEFRLAKAKPAKADDQTLPLFSEEPSEGEG
jgi:hypothetical protein